MTIAELRAKCKSAAARVPRDMLIVAILILASSASFGLGFLAGENAGQGSGIMVTTSPLVATSSDGSVIASKNGTKFYLPWCSGVDRISEANKITFPSADAARAQGYAPAANCPGI